MTNGEDYARIVADFVSDKTFDEFQISWLEFIKICDLFDKNADITIKDGMVHFKEGKTKLKCAISRSDAHKQCYFKFNFETAVKICMDDVYIIKTKLNTIPCFAMSKNWLASTDGNYASINYLKNDIGDGLQLFTTKFPAGMWFFNTGQRLIVSEDKRIACTIKKAACSFPDKAIMQISEQPLSNWLEVDCKLFKECIDKCLKIDEKIILEFAKDEIIVKSHSKEYSSDFNTSMPAVFDHEPKRKDLRFLYEYLIEFCRCADENGKLKILFDDTQTTYMVHSSTPTLKVFGMSLRPV